MKNINSILILPDIRSAINVGAIFRTADAAGISQIFLVGCTPRPTDTFGRVQKDIAKSALGAETWIPWKYEKSLLPLINKFKKDFYWILFILFISNSYISCAFCGNGYNALYSVCLRFHPLNISQNKHGLHFK